MFTIAKMHAFNMRKMLGLLGKYASLYMEIYLVPYLSSKERREDQADMLIPACIPWAQI
jgi:hypothetical protein